MLKWHPMSLAGLFLLAASCLRAAGNPTPTVTAFNPDPCTTTTQVGASTPFTSLEAEAGTLGGGATIVAVTTPPVSQYSSPELEASGHAYVLLNNDGQYVQWTNNTGQDITAINLRSTIPDAPGGGGIDSTVDLYVDGVYRQSFPVNSHQNYCYEEIGVNYNDQTDKTPAAGYYPRDFWNDTHAFVSGAPIAPGSTFSFRMESDDNASYYGIDVVDVENPPPALSEPANAISITDAPYNAVAGNMSVDNTGAINACFAAAQAQGKIAWIPQGTFYFSAVNGGLQATGITIEGAGPWYSTLYRVTPANNTQGIANIIEGVSCTLENVLLDCNAVSRAGNNNNGAVDFSGDNWLVDNVWIQHVTSSFWCAGNNGVAENCRTLSTWADGGNFNNVQDSRGIGTNLTYRNNFVRGTGDDAMAINSVNYNVDGGGNTTYYTMMQNITYENNTAIAPWGGQCMGIYGGFNDVVRNNLLEDSPRFDGLGVTRFGVNGSDLISASVTNNTLLRCGGNGYGQRQAAIMIGNAGNAQGVGTIENAYVGGNTIGNALYDGVDFSTSTNNVLEGNTISSPGANGIAVGSAGPSYLGTASGYAILQNNTVTNLNFAQSAVAPQGGSGFPLYSPTLAASYNASSGVQTETCSEGLQDVGFISNGSTTEYNQVSLAGMLSFTARVAGAGPGGNIEIHLDSPTGTLIGTCAVPVTGCWQGWQDVSCSLSGASGTHNLYLVYTGGAGNLFNIQWFFLSGSGTPPTPTPTPGPAPGCPQADAFSGSSLSGFWQGANVGNAGSSSVVEAGSLSVTTASGDIGGTGDNFFYVYQPTGQDVDARLKVNFTAGNWNAKSGIMLRDSTDPGAVEFYIAATYSCCGYETGVRSTTGGNDNVTSTGNGAYSSGAAPAYLRVVRSGTTFTSYYSGDGSAWTLGSSQVVPMASNYLIGVCTSTGNGSVSTASYNNFTVLCNAPTPTPSATAAQGTPTATPTPSPSATRTASPSPTASPTGTTTATDSPSATPTASPSATASRTWTPTASPSIPASPTPSPSATAVQGTRSASPTMSPSSSATPSPSLTASPTGSTSATPPASATPTAGFTGSASPTPSPSATSGASPSATPSPRPSSSPSPTDSASPTANPSPSATSGASPSATPSPRPSSSPSPTANPSPSATPSASPSATPSPRPSSSPSPTASASPTASPSATPTADMTGTPMPSPTATPSGTAAPSSAAGGPGALSGVNLILQAVPVPNPNPGVFAVDLEGPADQVTLRLYSKAMDCVLVLPIPGAYQAGWNRVPLPAGWSDCLANDLYYAVLESRQNGLSRQARHPVLIDILK